MAMRIYSGNPHSEGAKALSEELDIWRIKHGTSRYKPKVGDKVINWGATQLPNFAPATVINKPEHIQLVSNKLDFFRAMISLSESGAVTITPEFTPIKSLALQEWINQGITVVCRTILNGSGGAGIVIAKTPDQLVDAPLYVQYVNKKDEFRVHIMNKRVIDVQKKARRMDMEQVNWQVRNHANGFIYKRQDVNAPQCVIDVAIKCMNILPIDFGAVDVIYNAHHNRAYVLEVNSAPGLEGQTVKNYAKAFRENYSSQV